MGSKCDVEWEVNTLMLASLGFLLSGACVPLCPAMEGAGMAHGYGMGEGWQCQAPLLQSLALGLGRKQ